MKIVIMKLRLVFVLTGLVPVCTYAQQRFFSDVSEAAIPATGLKRVIVPNVYKTVRLDTITAVSFLRSLPLENTIINRNTSPVILLPMPDGSSARFRIWESSIMEPSLAARFSSIRTFTGQGIDDPAATLKADWTAQGFHAQILSPISGSIYIDPYAQGTLSDYISYYKKDYVKAGTFKEFPPINIPGAEIVPASPNSLQSTQCIGTNLRTYRLAVAATGEYTAFHGGTVALGQSAIVTTVNRLNGVFEKEIDIRMVLVANNSSLVYTNAGTDPFTNYDAETLIYESQATIDAIIGNANYDLGHIFSTGAGGLSGTPIVCISGYKALSATGQSSPVGDGYDIDYVAHEMGHALGANHTFNSTMGSCGAGSPNNVEPGSGTTIMAYAGICGGDDIQPHSDPQFHAASLDEISTYTFFAYGQTCGTLTSTGNIPPVVNAGGNFIIPKSTPFIMTGNATDGNSDPLTYSWEQIDIGGPRGPWYNPSGNAPLFRSFGPVTSPVRYFPRISDVVNNTTTIGEILPSYARTMRFRLTARDNRAGGGGVCFDSTSIKVDATAEAFAVTFPTAIGVVWTANDFKTITWNASTTAVAPIGCTNVIIQLSTDGGFTFPVTILASTPNDGSAEIQVPNNITTQARIRVMAVGNIFYDISNNNFTIRQSPTPDFALSAPAAIASCTDPSPATVLKSGSMAGFTSPITLAATNVPSGTSISFSANPVTPGNSTTITLNNANTLPAGIYNITITGSASGVSNKVRILSFLLGADAPSSLTLPAPFAVGVMQLPTFNWSAVTGALFYTLELSTMQDFSTIVQSITGIPSNGTTLTSPLSSNTLYFWRVKTTGNCVPGPGVPSAFSTFKTGLTPITYTFTGNGNWSVASNWVNNAIPPPNLPTNCAINISPAGSGQCIMNIPEQHILTGATFTVKAGKMIVIPGSVIVQ